MACAKVASLCPIAASEWRVQRHRWEADRLQKDLTAVVTIHPKLRLIGMDQRVYSFIRQFMLEEAGLAIASVQLGSRSIVTVGVGRRIWYSAVLRPRLFALKRAARQSGLTLLLAPQSVIRRQPRLGTARLIAAYLTFDVPTETRTAILTHVAATPNASLWSCSAVVRDRRRAAGSVLALIAEGVLTVSPAQPLNSSSPVRFRVAHPLTIPSAADDLSWNSEQVLPIPSDRAPE